MRRRALRPASLTPFGLGVMRVAPLLTGRARLSGTLTHDLSGTLARDLCGAPRP